MITARDASSEIVRATVWNLRPEVLLLPGTGELARAGASCVALRSFFDFFFFAGARGVCEVSGMSKGCSQSKVDFFVAD